MEFISHFVAPFPFPCMYVCMYVCGWIASGWEEAHFHNYRHYVTDNAPSVPWTNYPISFTRHGLTRAKVHSLAKWIAVSGNQTAIPCVAIKVHDHYIMALLFKQKLTVTTQYLPVSQLIVFGMFFKLQEFKSNLLNQSYFHTLYCQIISSDAPCQIFLSLS